MAPNNKSSVLNPIQFFETFFANDSEIKKLKAEFFERFDYDYPASNWNFMEVTEVDKKKETVTINYQKEIDWEYDDSNPELPTVSPKKVEWLTKTLYFKDHLYRTLQNEFFNSIEYCKLFYNSTSINTAKLKTEVWVNKLEKMLHDIEKNTKLKKYDENFRPPKALIRYLYKNYEKYCPVKTEELHNIILDVDNKLKNFEAKKIFTAAFYEKITEIKYKNNAVLSDMNDAKSKLLKIQNYKKDGELPIINFNWPIRASCYLLKEIQRHSATNFRITDLLRTGKITFNGKQLKPGAFDQNVLRYKPNKNKFTIKISWAINESNSTTIIN